MNISENKKHNIEFSKHEVESEKLKTGFNRGEKKLKVESEKDDGGSGKLKKVSVVIPNYNYGKYIRKRIESVVGQTYPIYEIIVLDDRSSDGSEVIAKDMVLDLKLANPEMKIQFVQNEENSGKAINQWKKGFELARGEFVWIAEADDLCSPRFLEEVMKGFDDPRVVLSYTESRVINGLGMMVVPNFRFSRDKEKRGHYAHDYVLDGEEEIREIMAIRCTIPNVSAVVFRKSEEIPFEDYLEEARKFSQVGDWYFYAKVLEHGKIFYSRKALNYFRVHRGSVTGKARGSKEHYKEVVKMHKYFEENYKLSEEVLGYMKAEEERIKGRL